MIYYEIVKVALQSLRVNPLRSVLTMLGIIIGVAAVIVMLGLGAGAQAAVEERISALGTRVLRIQRGWGHGGGGVARSRSVQRLELDDALALQEQVASLSAVVPFSDNEAQVEYGNINLGEVDIIGTWANWIDVNNFELSHGRFFTQLEVEGMQRVTVLGTELYEELFPDGGEPVGAEIRIQGIRFEIIGVLVDKGSGFGFDDDEALIPLSTALDRVFGSERLSEIHVEVAEENLLTMAMAEIEAVMRSRHRLRPGEGNDFRIESRTEYLEVLQESQQTFNMLLAGIAGVSLLVGGIGIMNILLVSVTERTSEIGIRKAVGARRGSVQLQFLIEAVVLSCSGGLIGVGLAWSAVDFVSGELGWDMLVPLDAVVGSFAVAAIIGIVFGFYPAVRASLLDPIDALRHE